MGLFMKEQLIELALSARKNAYVPYSHYSVGAAVMTEDGKVYSGCNIENASYGATNCAERTAIFKAVSEGARRIIGIAIAGGMEGREPVDYAYPCGVCRQVMKEFGTDTMKIYVAKSSEDFKELTLEELLPFGFGGDSIR